MTISLRNIPYDNKSSPRRVWSSQFGIERNPSNCLEIKPEILRASTGLT